MLAACVACLLFAAPAQAGWRVPRAKAIAAKAAGNPCDGNVTIRWEHELPDITDHGQGTDPLNAGATRSMAPDGWTFPGECVVHLNGNRRWSWDRLCVTMMHEYKHLAGYKAKRPYVAPDGTVDWTHSADQTALMYPRPQLVDTRCWDRGREYIGMRPGHYGWAND